MQHSIFDRFTNKTEILGREKKHLDIGEETDMRSNDSLLGSVGVGLEKQAGVGDWMGWGVKD